MKRTYVMLGLSLMAMGFLLAQTEADFPGIMKGVAAKNKSLKQNITAKMAAEATADAKALEGSFKQVETFFAGRGAAGKDAVGFAKQAREAAAAIPAQVAAGNFDAAGMSAATIGATCNNCHMAHREGEKGGPYKIK
jgi:hypothetical protein